MDNYIKNFLLHENWAMPVKHQHLPHKHRSIVYGAKSQFVPAEDTSQQLDTVGITRIQYIIGALLYYTRAVDNKLLVALSAIGSQQAKATTQTKAAVAQLLDYVATYPAGGLKF